MLIGIVCETMSVLRQRYPAILVYFFVMTDESGLLCTLT